MLIRRVPFGPDKGTTGDGIQAIVPETTGGVDSATRTGTTTDDPDRLAGVNRHDQGLRRTRQDCHSFWANVLRSQVRQCFAGVFVVVLALGRNNDREGSRVCPTSDAALP